ncbi:hypothetical protein Tco_1415557 [Tanacetum coccineum]
MSSDSASSEVTYTSISSHGDPPAWAVDFFRLQEPDSSEAAPASPDYVPGPEEPKQAPLSPDYILGPEYPEYLAPSDEEVPMEDQPYVVADSPIALSPGYVTDSDPEDSKDGPVDYPADGGDDDDDDSSDDDEEEEEASEEEEAEEEEEHLATADSVSAATPPSPPACRTTARISIRPETPVLLPPEEEVERLLALPAPPPSPLISLSPPSAEERLARCLAAPTLPSSPLPRLPHLYGSPNHMRAPPGFRVAMGRLRASSPLPPPLPSPPLPPLPPLPSPPLPPLPDSLFIPPVDHREDIPEAELPPRKRLCLTTPVSRYEVGESSTVVPRPTGGHRVDYGFISTMEAKARRQRAEAVGYGIRDTWVDPRETAEEDRQTQIHQTVEALVDDKQYYYETARLLDQEALDHRMDVQDSLIVALTAQVSSLQGHLATTLGEIRALQPREQARTDNNMPPKRTSAATKTTRAVDAAAALMTATAVEQLVTDRLSVALANHDTLRNGTNGHGDGSHNNGTGTR